MQIPLWKCHYLYKRCMLPFKNRTKYFLLIFFFLEVIRSSAIYFCKNFIHTVYLLIYWSVDLVRPWLARCLFPLQQTLSPLLFFSGAGEQSLPLPAWTLPLSLLPPRLSASLLHRACSHKHELPYASGSLKVVLNLILILKPVLRQHSVMAATGGVPRMHPRCRRQSWAAAKIDP